MNWPRSLVLWALLIQPVAQAGIFVGKGGLFHDPQKYEENLEKRIDEIREKEGILFDAIVTSNQIDGSLYALPAFRQRIVATPTALVFEGGGRMPYSRITSVRAGDYANPRAPSLTWEGVVVINESIAYRPVPENEKRNRGLCSRTSSTEQRILAEELARVIEKHRLEVDVFGKTLPPRPVDFAVVTDKAYVGWPTPPRYLNKRFSRERKEFQNLFLSTQARITDVFRNDIVEHLDCQTSPTNAFSLSYAGEFSFKPIVGFGDGHPATDPYGPNAYDNVNTKALKLQFEDLVVIGPISLWCSEAIAPQGVPGVKVTMRIPANFFDTVYQISTKPTSFYSPSVTLALQDWLDGGQERIIEELKQGIREVVAELNQELHARPIVERQEN